LFVIFRFSTIKKTERPKQTHS